MIFIYSTFPSEKEALKIGEQLLRKKMVAWANIFEIESVFSWKGRGKKGKECAAIFKTRKENFKKAERFILENHSYEIPCVIEIPLGRVTKKYLAWLKKGASAKPQEK